MAPDLDNLSFTAYVTGRCIIMCKSVSNFISQYLWRTKIMLIRKEDIQKLARSVLCLDE